MTRGSESETMQICVVSQNTTKKSQKNVADFNGKYLRPGSSSGSYSPEKIRITRNQHEKVKYMI